MSERTLVNYLTGTVPDDPWWMYVFNVVMLLGCIGLFVVIGLSW
jgi:hypothetical protein